MSQPVPSKTSQTNPITLSWIIKDHAKCSGQLGLCFCPGKKVVRDGVRHDRHVDEDLQRLRDHFQVTTIVCLLNAAELRSFSLRNYEDHVTQSGLSYISFPIVECAAPDSLPTAAAFVETLVQRLQLGEVLAVHCRGGVGRAGLVAACTLLRLGISANASEAMKMVRSLRCRTAVETRRQEDFVSQYAGYLEQQSPSVEDLAQT
mmetsp:Transcript_6316/g.13929  ORF Transcript_6316/g.13929 Transcript_6316/m.13929 type:complete len:204 (+) Transcript_6316:116-727(+)